MINEFFTVNFQMENRSCSRKYTLFSRELQQQFIIDGKIMGEDIVKHWGDPVKVPSPYGTKYQDEVPAKEVISISMSYHQRERLKQWVYEGQNRSGF